MHHRIGYARGPRIQVSDHLEAMLEPKTTSLPHCKSVSVGKLRNFCNLGPRLP